MNAPQTATPAGELHDITRNPEAIWLSPICDDTAHHGEGRTWAAPAPDDACEDCGEPWVRYVRSDLAHAKKQAAGVDAVRAVATRLQAEVDRASNECHDWLIAHPGKRFAPSKMRERLSEAEARLAGARLAAFEIEISNARAMQ